MSNDFIQNAVNALYQSNELMALKAENARLKEDAERYRLASLQGDVARLENARLKAEVERLTEAGDYLQRDVRLLSKDLLGKNPPTRHSEMEWNAAKGVQS